VSLNASVINMRFDTSHSGNKKVSRRGGEKRREGEEEVG
jgi:hypothetical protein